ncbi:MAG: response regulator [Deltaproteobacteria bacterium]|nr:response regulator [Deltaproteobacteria bacterium]
MNKRPVLLVEDDKVDAMRARRAFSELGKAAELEVVSDGVEALAYLSDPEKTLPRMVLLDLDLPRMNGLEVLRALREEGDWKSLPVIIMTTSRSRQECEESFSLCAAGYMIKPIGYNRFVEIIKTIDSYWELSELPR